MLLLMAGVSGAGKSTLALALGRVLGWPVLDKDTVKSTALDAGVSEQIAGPLPYTLLYALADDLVAMQQRSIIIDSPTAYPVTIQRLTAIAERGGARLSVVLLLADEAVRASRLRQRTARRSQPRTVEPGSGDGSARFGCLPPSTPTLRAGAPIEAMVGAVLAHLDAPSSDRDDTSARSP